MSRAYTNAVDNEVTATNKRCTISLDPKVYFRLKDEGIFGESFSELVGRLLDLLEERRRLEQEEPRLLDLLKEKKGLEQETTAILSKDKR